MREPWFRHSQLDGRIPLPVYVWAASMTFAVFFVCWHILAISRLFPELLLPEPLAVVAATYRGLFVDGWGEDVWVSSYRIFMGFVVSAVLAIPIGVLIGSYKIVEAFLEPFHSFIRYMPVVAFIPLCIMWFGVDDFQKVIVILIGTYFQLVLMVASASARVPREYIEIYYMFGGTSLGCLTKVIFPAAWPSIYNSLRIAAAWAWSYLVVAELVAAEVGIGFKIVQSQRFLQTPKVMAAILIIGILGILTDGLFRLISIWCFPWLRSKRA